MGLNNVCSNFFDLVHSSSLIEQVSHLEYVATLQKHALGYRKNWQKVVGTAHHLHISREKFILHGILIVNSYFTFD